MMFRDLTIFLNFLLSLAVQQFLRQPASKALSTRHQVAVYVRQIKPVQKCYKVLQCCEQRCNNRNRRGRRRET